MSEQASPLVPYRVTICGLAELCQHTAKGVTHVLTILDPDFPDPEDFIQYEPHQRTVWRFHDTILDSPDMVPPREPNVEAILEFGEEVRGGRIDHLLVHCHMGISRSTAAAAILLAQHNPGREFEAFEHLRAIRPQSWPNSRMVRLADAMLDREGRLVEAMLHHHGLVARAYPDFAKLLKMGERKAEVPDDI